VELRRLTEQDRRFWNEFTAASPAADVLQSYEWGELKETFGWIPHRLLFEQGGEPVAAASVLERPFRAFRRSLFYCSRGPVLDYSNRDLLVSVLEGLRDYCRRQGGFLLKLDPAVELPGGQPVADTLTSLGFRRLVDEGGFGGTQPRCVMKLDLTPSPDELLAACKSKTRYNIRLASRKGVTVRDNCTPAEVDTFYDLLQVTTERDRFTVRPRAYFHRLWELLEPAGFARLALAYYEDEPIAGALVTRFGDTCCYLYGASANRHRNRMPNHLVQWHLIQWARAQGCRVYDFRGVSPHPEADDHLAGLNRFKAGFGARFVEYVGEFDLPLAQPHYFVWAVGKPAAVNLLKKLRRRSLQ